MSGDIVLLGCGHAHISALRHWRSDRRPVVVTHAASEAYSGLVPSALRGERVEAGMRLDRAVAAAGGRLVVGTCAAIDLAARVLRLEDGRAVPFGLLSLGLGARTAAPDGAIGVRPAAALPGHIARIEEGSPGTVAVVGGGAAGTELAIALARRWTGRRAVILAVPDGPLPHAPTSIRRRAARALDQAGVRVVAGRAMPHGAPTLVMEDRRAYPVAAVLWAAGLVASALPRAAGVACDPDGFVEVDAGLRSVSHPFVFAAGDGIAGGLAGSGAVAVRAGAALAVGLACAAAGRAPPAWRPPAKVLAAIGVGDGRGLAWRGGLWLAGRSAWWLKHHLDERWMAGLR